MQVGHGVAAAQSQPAVSKADASKVWALAASTQDDDLLDDDELLTEEDQRPPVVPGTLQLREEDQRVLAVLGCARCTFPLVGCWALAADRAGPEAARGARCARYTSSVGVPGNCRVVFMPHCSEAEQQRRFSGWLRSQLVALTCS